MSSRACLDAGLITLYFQKECPVKVEELFNRIQNGNVKAFVPRVVMVEAFKHLCVAYGKEHAKDCMDTLEHVIPVEITGLTPDETIKAGELKCQHRAKLSYNDCIGMSIALSKNASFHTTEKDLPNIPGLTVREYPF